MHRLLIRCCLVIDVHG